MIAHRNPKLVLFVAVAAIAGCSAFDSTAPVPLQPTERRFDIDSVPDAHCRSGYATPNGKCTGEE